MLRFPEFFDCSDVEALHVLVCFHYMPSNRRIRDSFLNGKSFKPFYGLKRFERLILDGLVDRKVHSLTPAVAGVFEIFDFEVQTAALLVILGLIH